jgi:hypothetical protein
VFVYFPDRAGGEIEWFGVEIRSAAAGLPLIRSRRDCRRLGGFTSAIDPPYTTRRYSPGLTAEETEPEKTTHAPLTARIAGDRNTALKLAEPAAVDKLFSGPSLKVNAKELACHPVGTGQRLPDYSHQRNYVFRLRETNQGWLVENVDH